MNILFILFNIIVISSYLKAEQTTNIINIDINIHERSQFLQIKLYFGNPPMEYEYLINTLIHFTNIKDLNYIKSSYKLIKTGEVHVNDIKEVANQIEDCLHILRNQYSISNYSLYLSLYNTPNTWNEGFGFGLTFENEKQSIIHQLYNSNQINHKSFYIFLQRENNINYNTKGKLVLGKPTISQLNKYQYYGKCQIKNHSIDWGCVLDNITIGNKTYPINKEAIFSSCQYFSILSTQFLNIIYDNLFKPLEKKDECYLLAGFSRDRIICSYEIISLFTDISFHLGEMTITIPIKQLFDCDSRNCASFFASNRDDNSTFQFGSHFIKLFNVSGFDYTSREISLYSNVFEIKMNKNNNSMKVILWLFAVICLFGCLLQIWKQFLSSKFTF